MNGNQTFSFPRFGALIKKSWIEDWRSILLSGGSMLGLLTLTGILIAMAYHYEGQQAESYGTNMLHIEAMWFGFYIIVGALLFASRSFSTMATPQSSLSTLMVPASQFEKYLYRLILAIPVYFIVMFILVVVADWLRVIFVELYYNTSVRPINWSKLLLPDSEVYADVAISGSFFRVMARSFLVLLMAQSFFFLGAIVWPKHSMLKTFLSIVVIIFGYVLWAAWIMTTFENDGMSMNGLSWIDDKDTLISINNILCVIIAIFNYWLAYRRFRESEIINRW